MKNPIQETIDLFIARKEELGVSFVLTRDGDTVYAYSAGLADVAEKKPFTGKTICRAYSCSKIVTGLAAVMLMERGRLDPCWELSRFFPEYAHAHVMRFGKACVSRPLVIRDLMNMTSGLAYPGEIREGGEATSRVWEELDKSIQAGSCLSTREFAQKMGEVPLIFAAGEEWMYGSSADVLGAVIEAAADMEFAAFLEKEIFSPLGMEDTAFFVPAQKRDRLAVLYETAGENPKLPEYTNLCIYDFEEKPAFQSGGAGLFSTAEDYAKLGAALSSGGAGLVSAAGIRYMQTEGLNEAQRKSFNWPQLAGHGYGCLMRHVRDRNAAGLLAGEGSFGWDGWTGTYLMMDPGERLSVTLFLQRCGAGTTPLARLLTNAAYGFRGQDFTD